MELNKIITDVHNICKSMARYDTGNLRENAIKVRNRRANGFTITYSIIDAHYIEYVEEGTIYQKGQHFIAETAEVLVGFFAPKARAYADMDKGLKVDNPERRLRHAESIFRYYQSQKE